MATNMTSVVQATEAQTKAITSGSPDKSFQDEIAKAISANTAGSEANANALRVLAERIDSPNAASSGESLSQKAFDVVKGVRENLNDLFAYVEKFSKEKDPSTASLFTMQYKVTQMSILMDVSSKVGDKGSQAFQTLFRNQG
jgi:hypothetical protein